MCVEGSFREDLFYRINVLRIDVPGLSERSEDISVLAQHWAENYSKKTGSPTKRLSAEALESLKSYSWPGNVRELENLLERASAFSDSNELGAGDFTLSGNSEQPSSSSSLAGRSFDQLERQALIDTLKHCDGSRNQAAEMLGVSLKSVYNKIKKYEL